ncbi:bifunctional 2',3'-cyclic-nucleotide 2'-phosphodiesterase/3'-nucleotidase [Ferrimonas pelagia]|uniref:Bifunctional 2',3'-cyclic-nucleotide 2'-phosphodiesterase/3'-nucleotidase n=1 Tax=Ferrimonas pelagia TaxID=1177826 RepID=A0ABP9ETR1_9GAMM
MNTKLLKVLALSAVSLVGCSQPNAPTQLELRIVQTTDLHVNMMGYDYYRNAPTDQYGLSYSAPLIHQARAEHPNVMLFDNGDLIQGNPMGDYVFHREQTDGYLQREAHPVFKAMNQLGYDAGNMGNHEFNYGLDFLHSTLATADFPYINANVLYKQAPDEAPYGKMNGQAHVFNPYLLLKRDLVDNHGQPHSLTVGVLGLTPPQIMNWDKRHLYGRVETLDMVETAEHYVPQMRAEGADIVVVIAHAGISTDAYHPLMENAGYYLAGVDGVDALLLGHSHRRFPGDFDGIDGVDNAQGLIQGTATVMPGVWGNHIGLIDLSLSQQQGQWQVDNTVSFLRAIDPKGEQDNGIIDAIAADHQNTNRWLDQALVQIASPIHSFFALMQDDPSIQIVTDAQSWHVQKLIAQGDLPDLPLLSAGAPFRGGRNGVLDYTFIEQGDLALRSISDLYVYPNTLNVMQVDGATVKEWLEMSAGQFNHIHVATSAPQTLINTGFPSYNFDVIDGVSYRIDITQPARYDTDGSLVNPDAERIVGLSYDGAPIDPAQTFLVVTNNYRGNGGGNFPGVGSEQLIWDDPEETRNILSAYLQELANSGAELDPRADDNWSLLLPSDSVTVQFTSSPNAHARAVAEQTDAFDFVELIEQTDHPKAGFALYRLNAD